MRKLGKGDKAIHSTLKVLVLGTNGQLGWQLLNKLADAGEHRRNSTVHSAGDRASAGSGGLCVAGATRSDLEVGGADRSAIEAKLGALLDRHQPDWVINAIAYTAVDRAENEVELAHQVNGWFPSLLGIQARSIPVIHFSSDYVFDGKSNHAYRESDRPAPLSVYGASKLQGEGLLLEANSKALVLRCSWVVGAHGQNFARTILRLACERDSLRVVADQWGVPTPTDFIVEQLQQYVLVHKRWPKDSSDQNKHLGKRAFHHDRESSALALDRPLTGLYHLVPSGETNWYEYACAILRQAKQHPAWASRLRIDEAQVVPISTAQYPTPAPRPANSRLDTSKWREATGQPKLPEWCPVLIETISQLLEAEACSAPTVL